MLVSTASDREQSDRPLVPVAEPLLRRMIRHRRLRPSGLLRVLGHDDFVPAADSRMRRGLLGVELVIGPDVGFG